MQAVFDGLPASAAAAALGLSTPAYAFFAAATLALGFFGIYFVNNAPFGELTLPLAIAAAAMTTWVIGMLVWALKAISVPRRSHLAGFSILLLVLLAIGVSFVVRDEYWAAGKVLVWLAPLLTIAISLPLLLRRSTPGPPRVLIPIAAGWLLLQLGFAATWPLAVRAPDGIHRSAPYPAIQDTALKTTFDWDQDALAAALRDCPITVIDADSMWTRHYVMMIATEMGSSPVLVDPETPYIGADAALAPYPSTADGPYCVAAQVGRTFTLTRR
jgi:hypothetical protein